MPTFVIFIVSLFLIVFSLVMKSIEISRGRKIFLAKVFARLDLWLLKILFKIKIWWSHINFHNTKLIFLKITAIIRDTARKFKRHFDHEQSHFFTKRDHHLDRHKGPVSTFLKKVSDHKKTLRDDAVGGRA